MVFLSQFAKWLGRTASWCFGAIILVMVYEVVARYGFGAPTAWAHEVSVMLAGFAFIFGGAYCMAEGTHMRISVLVENRPTLERLSHWLSVAAGLSYLSGLAYASWRMADRAIWRFALDGTWTPERTGSSFNAPVPAFLKGMLFVGAVLFLVVLVNEALKRRSSAP
ncbi:MAG: TRAP transporter small permease subunit [Rhizobiales bacterium]|nr:TRAP transporter small permease subunit [Hyphomicrobiales bacterium]MBO6698548.1 TRAP transporter small permease subunit [Hyphomicrobiales bacterium]MBO6735198.1 TRAP transporter small permease subunit [Hyphomicrobiales bacterium]MBO6910994.1 TRAP transporter small permease subunit [Hyphomicrobiales bacterium]MBO6957213.1 TRAP transporter small permease subunit [Hyphomicrobiales bacterium]